MLGKSRCDLRFVEYIETFSSTYILNFWFLMLPNITLQKFIYCPTSSFNFNINSFKNVFCEKATCVHAIIIYFSFKNRKSALNELKSQKIHMRFKIYNL